MFYHIENGSSKPCCKQIMRFCINHATQISDDDSMIRIQVLH